MPGPLVRRLVLTAAATWMAVRLALGMLGYVQVTLIGAAGVAVATLVVARLDLRRNDEVLLYANLGVSPVPVGLLVVTVALTLEFLVAAPLSLLVGQAAPVPMP